MNTKTSDLITHGSKTRRINEIIEDLCVELRRLPKYREVEERYAAEGGNANTAKTQYGMWKRSQRAGKVRETINTVEQHDQSASPDQHPGSFDPIPLTIDAHGGLTIPPEMRAAMLLGTDGKITARVEDGELRVIAPRVAIRRAREIARKYTKPGVSVVDQFLAERRAMWGEE